MKKNEFSSSILGVKLYLDDIELIISKIQNLSDNFQISDDENIYQSIEELREFKGDNPRKIELKRRHETGFWKKKPRQHFNCNYFYHLNCYNKLFDPKND